MASNSVTQAPNMFSSVVAPDLAAQQMQLQRQQELAALLRKQALEPIGQTEVVSGRAVPVSPLQGIAKILQAGMGAYMQDQNDQQQQTLNRGMAQRYADILRGGNGNGPDDWVNQAPGGSGAPGQGPMPGQLGSGMTGDVAPPDVGTPQVNLGDTSAPPVQNTAPVIPQSTGAASSAGGTGTPNPFSLASILRGQVIGSLGGDPAAGAYWKSQELPDAVKTNNYYGLGQGEVADSMRRDLATKGQQVVRPDSTLTQTNADGTIKPLFTAPNVGAGTNLTWDNGAPTVSELSGAADVKRSMEAAALRGKNSQTLAPPSQSPTLPNGQIQPTTIDSLINPQQPAQTSTTDLPPGGLDMSKVTPQQLAAMQQRDPAAMERGIADFQRTNAAAPQGATPQGVGPAFGQQAGAEVMAKANAKGYQDLKTQAGGAADRINVLDGMLDLANGGTKYGPGTTERITRLSTINSYLPSGMALGGNDTTNAQVFQKYAANLAGQYQKALGGTGSDAQLANSIKSIANPDMTNAAIKEVVPKLKALESGVQAKINAYDNWLAQPGNTIDQGHRFESQFRQAYDPRVFQLQQMSPQEQQAYVKNLSPADAKTLLQKRSTLKSMGAF